MATIQFFCIPAHGHVNPTLDVVRALRERGHRVVYYSFPEFEDKIVYAGAEYRDISFAMPALKPGDEVGIGRDFAMLIEMVTSVTIALDDYMRAQMAELKPSLIVTDSVCFWGKLFAQRYDIPMVCSTTTLAFNKHTARLMRRGIGDILSVIKGAKRMNDCCVRLREHGYAVKDVQSLIGNDNETDTIVYTSRGFQPMAETFSERYAFVGPSLRRDRPQPQPHERRLVYISMGTVLNRKSGFYRTCISALKGIDADIVMSVGKDTDIEALGILPENIRVYPTVDQLEVLSRTDVFLTHCGMNSVQESLYYGVPMVLWPQHGEETAVAGRVAELGAGVLLKRTDEAHIREAVSRVLREESYRKSAERVRREFLLCGGGEDAAAFIDDRIG